MAGIDSYSKLVVHANEVDGSTTPADSSLSPKTLTAVGNAQVDTAQFPSITGATGSLLFDGTGDTFTVPDSADWYFAAGNFTVDFWVRLNASVGDMGFITQRVDSTNAWAIARNSTTGLRFIQIEGGATTIDISGSWSPSLNTWYHIAVVRGWSGNANDYAVCVDGTAIATGTDATDVADFAAVLSIGTGRGVDTNGWIGEVRVSKGIARWTANFTPPTAQYSLDVNMATWYKGIMQPDCSRGRIII